MLQWTKSIRVNQTRYWMYHLSLAGWFRHLYRYWWLLLVFLNYPATSLDLPLRILMERRLLCLVNTEKWATFHSPLASLQRLPLFKESFDCILLLLKNIFDFKLIFNLLKSSLPKFIVKHTRRCHFGLRFSRLCTITSGFDSIIQWKFV